MEEAFAAAKEKLTDMVSDFMYRSEAIPPPSLPADIINRRQQDNEQFAGFVVTFVGVVIVSTLNRFFITHNETQFREDTDEYIDSQGDPCMSLPAGERKDCKQ
eukprot:gene27051-biopygen794